MSPGVSPGFSLCSVEEEGIRRLYVNGVKDTGLAFKKGKTHPRDPQISPWDRKPGAASQCSLGLGLLPLLLLPARPKAQQGLL